jgi:uncharacterized phage protein gp47/JayE
LKKKQLETQIKALLSKKPNISVQLSALQSQLATAEKEKIRIANLVKGDAATTKQLDDINANIEVIKKQIEAQKSSLEISSEGIGKDANTNLCADRTTKRPVGKMQYHQSNKRNCADSNMQSKTKWHQQAKHFIKLPTCPLLFFVLTSQETNYRKLNSTKK